MSLTMIKFGRTIYGYLEYIACMLILIAISLLLSVVLFQAVITKF